MGSLSLDFALLVAVRASPHSVAIHHMICCPNTAVVNGLSLLVAGKTLRTSSRKELSCLIGLAVQHPVSKKRQVPVVPQVPQVLLMVGFR